MTLHFAGVPLRADHFGKERRVGEKVVDRVVVPSSGRTGLRT